MQDCPALEVKFDKTSIYILTLDVLSILSVVLNVYAMYCIVFRSSKQMRIYRWYLLVHQFVAAGADFYMSFLFRLVTLMPFPIIFSAGAVDNFLHCRHFLPIAGWLEAINMVTIGQLFVYRYCGAKGHLKIPLTWKILIFLAYCYTPTVFVTMEYAYAGSEVLKQYRQNYSCINDVSETNLCAYSLRNATYFIVMPACVDFIVIGLVFIVFIFISYRAINVKYASLQLKRRQKEFMIQLITQTFLPFAIVMGPTSATFFAVIQGSENSQALSHLAAIGMSLFGSTGALVLIAMNKNYRNLPFSKKQRVMSNGR